MKPTQHLLFFFIFSTGLTTLVKEVLAEEATASLIGLTDQPVDPEPVTASTETPSTDQNLLNRLWKALWKLIQLDFNITSGFNRKIAGPFMQAINMGEEPEATLIRVLGLLQRNKANENT